MLLIKWHLVLCTVMWPEYSVLLCDQSTLYCYVTRILCTVMWPDYSVLLRDEITLYCWANRPAQCVKGVLCAVDSLQWHLAWRVVPDLEDCQAVVDVAVQTAVDTFSVTVHQTWDELWRPRNDGSLGTRVTSQIVAVCNVLYPGCVT